LQGNALQHIPESLENLPLDEIVLPADLPTQVLSGLARAYPKAMGAWYKSKGYQVAHQSQHTQRNGTRVAAKAIAKKALSLLEKVPETSQDDSYWFSLGLACVNAGLYERSIEANLKLIALNPKYGSGVAFYNIACAYANMGEKEKMITYLQLATKQTSYMDWYGEAREDNDFEKYWQDEDLLAL
jgi:tetratricopeptide (TPR) repeat protein